MMRYKAFALLIPIVFIAGCVAPGQNDVRPPRDIPPSQVGSCDPRGAAWAVGLTATDQVIERAWRDSGSRFMRIIRPGEVVTMEFNPERVNLELDRFEVIRAVRCG